MIPRMKSVARFSHSFTAYELSIVIPKVFRDKGGIVSVQLADVYSLLNLYCLVQLPSGSSS